MSEIEHTPTPWELSRSTGNAFPYVITYPEGDGNCLDYQWSEANVEFIITAVNAYDKHRALIETLTAALTECEDYFDNRADAEYFTDSAAPVPNEEMTLLTLVRDALAAAKKEGF